MPNLLGPSAFGALRAAAIRPSVTPDSSGADTWWKDCSSPINRDGTELRAAWFNSVMAQLRAAIRAGRVTEDNADEMLLRAIRSNGPNYYEPAAVSGTANAITLASALAPFTSLADLVGVPLRFVAKADSTATVSIAVDGLAATPLRYTSGDAAGQNALRNGGFVEMFYDGTAFVLTGGAPVSPPTEVYYRTPGTTSWISPITGFAEVTLWGAGGGGGGAKNTAGSAASGGGAGGKAAKRVAVIKGTSYAVVVGAGGTGGTGGAGTPTSGTTGGTSSFGGVFSATGGGPGNAADGGTQTNVGVGGTGVGGDTNWATPSGGVASLSGGGQYFLAVGGQGLDSTNNGAIQSGTLSNGLNGVFTGNGGGGGLLGGAGGNGGDGQVLIKY